MQTPRSCSRSEPGLRPPVLRPQLFRLSAQRGGWCWSASSPETRGTIFSPIFPSLTAVCSAFSASVPNQTKVNCPNSSGQLAPGSVSCHRACLRLDPTWQMTILLMDTGTGCSLLEGPGRERQQNQTLVPALRCQHLNSLNFANFLLFLQTVRPMARGTCLDSLVQQEVRFPCHQQAHFQVTWASSCQSAAGGRQD